MSHEIPSTPGPHVPIREATAYGEGTKYLTRDHDGKFGVDFARVAKTSNIEILKTPIMPRKRMPSVNGSLEV